MQVVIVYEYPALLEYQVCVYTHRPTLKMYIDFNFYEKMYASIIPNNPSRLFLANKMHTMLILLRIQELCART